MITGYNTDVRHREAVLHVQTEDKGLANPFIESLIYCGGRVLVARRVSYADLLANGLGEKEIIALMDRQHRTMIAAIRSGKFDNKIDGILGGAEATEGTVASPARAEGPELAAGEPSAQTLEKTLDQVILEYLTHEAEQEQLVLLVEEGEGIALGDRARLRLRASSSKSGEAVGGASVLVKMISTAEEPRVLATGHTNPEGRLRIEFQIPRLDRGTSALIISAASKIGRAELKQLL